MDQLVLQVLGIVPPPPQQPAPSPAPASPGDVDRAAKRARDAGDKPAPAGAASPPAKLPRLGHAPAPPQRAAAQAAHARIRLSAEPKRGGPSASPPPVGPGDSDGAPRKAPAGGPASPAGKVSRCRQCKGAAAQGRARVQTLRRLHPSAAVPPHRTPARAGGLAPAPRPAAARLPALCTRRKPEAQRQARRGRCGQW